MTDESRRGTVEVDSKGKADKLPFYNDWLFVGKSRFLYPNSLVVPFVDLGGMVVTSTTHVESVSATRKESNDGNR